MRYKPIIARPYLCVCALLEMVIQSTCGQSPDQMEIAQYLGVHVPFGHQIDTITNLHYTKDLKKWGVMITSNELNALFKHYKLPLKEVFFSINLFEDWSFEDKITELLSAGAHIVCGCATEALYYHSPSSEHLGHAVTILNILSSEGLEKDVLVYDPGPRAAGQHRLRAWQLFAAIKARSDGIWAIVPTGYYA